MQTENIDVPVARAFLSKLPLTLQNDSHTGTYHKLFFMKKEACVSVNIDKDCNPSC